MLFINFNELFKLPRKSQMHVNLMLQEMYGENSMQDGSIDRKDIEKNLG